MSIAKVLDGLTDTQIDVGRELLKFGVSRNGEFLTCVLPSRLALFCFKKICFKKTLGIVAAEGLGISS